MRRARRVRHGMPAVETGEAQQAATGKEWFSMAWQAWIGWERTIKAWQARLGRARYESRKGRPRQVWFGSERTGKGWQASPGVLSNGKSRIGARQKCRVFYLPAKVLLFCKT